jgi:hypothetical protein
MKLSISPLLLAAFAFSAYAAPSDPSANELNHLEQRQRGGGDVSIAKQQALTHLSR